MQTMDLRRGNFEANDLIVQCDAGSYVVACGAEGENEVVFVPRDDDAARREQARLAEIAGPGIPRSDTHPAPEPGRVIVRLVGLAGAVPLHVAAPLTAAELRAALTRLTSALSHAHSRGWFHGRIAAPLVLVDPQVACWLVGWADARPIRPGARNDAGLDEVSRDLRDVGMALLRHLLRAPPDAAGDLSDDEVEAAVIAIRADDPELARVLARLASADQRECYESATEVLTDLGERDESMPDVWAELPFVGRRSIVRLVMRRLELAGGPEGGLSSLELAGPAGSGRSRLLEECARAARERGIAVIVLDGRTGAQPWGPLGDLARQLLARTPADAPARQAPALTTLLAACVTETADVVARRPAAPLETADGVAAALADLAQAALGGHRAVLLLDDEDCLHPSARSAWRLLGRHVAETTDTHQALRALLVSTTTAAAPPRAAFPGTDTHARPERNTVVTDETGARHETIRIEDLTRPRIHRLLTSMLAEPGMAAALVHDVHDLTGGRIAEIVEHLRLLAARGILRPVGRRWRLHDPGTPFRAITIPEATRRTLADAGPEATRIAELLAITPDMRLDRATLIELAEIPPHRFQSAVDAAERLGLILRAGAAWRLRTQTLRARIDAALPAERRRSLHREILFRLLDATPRDLPAIATHARGAGDPRAVEWTREAIAYLMSARRHPEVVAHYEESRDLIDPAGIDTSLKLDYCEALLEVGRIGPAADGARTLLCEPLAKPSAAGRAIRILLSAARASTNWRGVLDIPLPDDCDNEPARAECRLLRALANFRLSKGTASAREERLASAEIGAASPTASVRAAQHTLDGMRLTKSGAFHAGIPHLLRAYHCELRAGRPQQSLVTLQTVATALRNAGDQARSVRILSLVAGRVRRRGYGSPALLCRNHSMLALNTRDWRMRPQTLRHLELAVLYCQRATSGAWAVATRVVLTLYRIEFNAARRADREFIESLIDSDEESASNLTLDIGVQLSPCLFYFGMYHAIDVLASRALASSCPPESRAAFTIAMIYARLSVNAPIQSILDSVSSPSIDHVSAAMCTRLSDATIDILRGQRPIPQVDTWNPSLAAYILRGAMSNVPSSGALPNIDSMAADKAAEHPFFGDADLALTVGLMGARSCPLGPEAPGRVGVPSTRLPLALEWRRLVLQALRTRRAGRFDRAEQIAASARTQASAWLRDRLGGHLAHAKQFVDAVLTEHLLARAESRWSPPRRESTVERRRPPQIVAAADSPVVWHEALAACAADDRRLFVFSDAEQAELFIQFGRLSGIPLHTRFPGIESPPPSRRARLELRLIDLWSDEHLRHEVACLIDDGSRRQRTIGTLLSTPLTLSARGPVPRAVVELLGSRYLVVPDLLREPVARREAVALLWSLDHAESSPLPAATVDRLVAHPWPGGVPELRGALRQVARAGGDFDSASWSAHEGMPSARTRPGTAVVGRVLEFLNGVDEASVQEVARAAGLPLRTTQRRLQELVHNGVLVRSGAGRASRYARRRGPSQDEP